MHTLDTFLPLTAFIVFQRAFIGEATLSFKEQCLKWHNDYRSIHQAPTVTWNDTIAADAEVWATYLADNNAFAHATNLGQLDQGENLYLVSVQPTEPCTDATKAFYEEIKDYNFDQPGFSSQTGHFTQVVWKSTRQIGAASKTRADGQFVVVVRYSPPGNVDSGNYFKDNVLPSQEWQAPTDSGVAQISYKIASVVFSFVFSFVWP